MSTQCVLVGTTSVVLIIMTILLILFIIALAQGPNYGNKPGESCDTSRECQAGGVCRSGKCQIPVGASCETYDECAGSAKCRDGVCRANGPQIDQTFTSFYYSTDVSMIEITPPSRGQSWFQYDGFIWVVSSCQDTGMLWYYDFKGQMKGVVPLPEPVCHGYNFINNIFSFKGRENMVEMYLWPLVETGEETSFFSD